MSHLSIYRVDLLTGPPLTKTKNLKDGHFTRKSQNIKSYMVSEAVDSLNNILKKNQLME